MDGTFFKGQWGNIQLIFGQGSLDQVSSIVNSNGSSRRVAVLTGKSSMRSQGCMDRLISQFPTDDVAIFEGVNVNPTYSSCQQAANFLLDAKPDALIALGGGSVLDTAKIANVASGSGLPVETLLKTRSCGTPLNRLTSLFVAIPTTAGTGSEVTPFATVWDFETPQKYSLDTPYLLASHAVLDEGLTTGMSKTLTVTTALDALGHGMESFWSRHWSPFSSALALECIRIIVSELPHLVDDLQNVRRRKQILWASLLAGMAISMTRTAAAHAISYSLTLRFGVPHGLAVGQLLPSVLEANQTFLTQKRLEELKGSFGIDKNSDLVAWAKRFLEDLDVIKPLRVCGVTDEDVETIVQDSNVPGRMDNNCRILSKEDLNEIVKSVV